MRKTKNDIINYYMVIMISYLMLNRLEGNMTA